MEDAPEIADKKRDKFVELLEDNDGRMKQSELVSETRWSAATVSRELSEMENDGVVQKISIGRSNLVALVGNEPEWYIAPETSAEEDDVGRDGAGLSDEPAILIIEDNEREVKLLKEAFREVGVTNPIHTVRDGSEAVDFLLQRGSYVDVAAPGLVLLDLGLKVVDGLDVLRELDDRGMVRQFPIVVMSHSDARSDVHQAYQLGATGYLRKPNDLEELIELADAIDAFWLSNTFHRPRPAQTGSSE